MRARVTSVGLIILPDPDEYFEYPVHIDRDSLDALPRKPGLYIFRDREGSPLYIGKSINIRARVLSHLRTAEESAMLSETHRVDFVRTAGEIGALLLESQWVKKLQPAYNVRLKDYGETFAIHLGAGETRPVVVGSSELDFNEHEALYGLFASRSEAHHGLSGLIRQHMLCPALLGLENTTHHRACFAHQIGRCLGACIGIESQATHYARMRTALENVQASVWPYAGPIGIVEESDGWKQVHIVNRWSYLGSLEGRRKKLRMPVKQMIDIDTYKILARRLREDGLEILGVTPHGKIP